MIGQSNAADERNAPRLTAEEWADAIYEATGWIVSNGLAAAIGGMVEAARRDAAGEVERLRAERAEHEKAIAVWCGRAERAEAERDRLAADLAKAHKDILPWIDQVGWLNGEYDRLCATLRRIGLPGKEIVYCRDGHEEAVLHARAALGDRA